MNWKEISSYSEMNSLIENKNKSFVLLYKKDSDSCICALNRLESLSAKDDKEINFLKVNVKSVRDIHDKYNITTVPSLLLFESSGLKNVIKGCMSEDFYNSVLNGIYNTNTGTNKNESKNKRVIVYSTPSCVWCTRLKNYFKEHSVKFQDVNVAVNQTRMEEMKRKSGQMGVPQTEIEGQMIVGFDKPKINRLLGLN